MPPSIRRTRRSILAQEDEHPEEQLSPTTRRGLRSKNIAKTPSHRSLDEDEDDLEESPVPKRPRGRMMLNSPEPSSGSEWNPSDEESEADGPLVDSGAASEEDLSSTQEDDLQDMDEELEDVTADLQHDEEGESTTYSNRNRQSQSHRQRHPDAPKISKLQEKVARKRKAGQNVTDAGRKKGDIRIKNGQLQFLLQGEWVKAVYHSDIREQLLKFTDQMGEYAVEPAKGADPWDRTAFHPDQAEVRFSPRDARPECLFQWMVPNSLEDSMPEPTLWYHYGCLVLDIDNRPVRVFKELPLTLSGQCEGLRMEMYRRTNPLISGPDLRARMPDVSRCGPTRAVKTMKMPALANRMARERYKIGLRAMYSRKESLTKEKAMIEMIPPHIQEEIVRTNSTRCFRDLSTLEFQYVERTNKGTQRSLNKASTRRVTDAEREKRVAKQEKYLKKGKLVIHPVIPEILNQKSDRYGPGRRIRKAATFASYVASHGNPALDTQKDEEEDHEEDYDQEESLQATPDQAEEESEEFDLPSRGHPRKRRRVAPAEEEERRSAILAQPGHRLGLWTDDSTVPATHVQRPPTGFGHADEHADESFLGGLHEGFQSYRYEPSSHSTQEYNSQSIASGQLQPLFFPDHSYSPQFHEPQIGQQGPLPNPSQTPSYGFITGDLLVDPFDNLYANTAGFGIPDNQPGSAIPMQDPSWTAQTPQMMFDDTSAGLSAELLEMADTIDWNAYELPDLPE